MARKPSRAVFLSKELEDSLKRLDPDHRFNRWVADMKSVLKENMFAGECIGKKRIPKHYARRYGVNNLYRYDHPEGFRSCYTLVMCEGLGVCPLIIDLKTHTDYDKVFGYKTT